MGLIHMYINLFLLDVKYFYTPFMILFVHHVIRHIIVCYVVTIHSG